MASEHNWAGNYTYAATRLHEPATVDELRRIVSRAPKIHALGTRHSFNGIADSTELVSLERLQPAIEIDLEARTVTVGAQVRYGTLARALEQAGMALHTMASLPHISVGGAIATATHGSGNTIGNLASAVTGLELITSEGDIISVDRDAPDFAGMVVSLGALGIVTRVTLAIEPSYRMRQHVFENLDWATALARFDEITASATSVSLFTDYGDTVNQVWLKQRVDGSMDDATPDSFHGARAATRPRHPIPELTGESCTEQLGVPGAWLDRLPHFRMDFTPSNGEEIQSEYLIPRENAVAALQALRELGTRIRPHLMISELRTIAADDLWLSMAFETDCVGIHFTWKRDPAGVDSVLPGIEAALAPLGARPHWGKHFLMSGSDLEERYDRLPDFRRLAARLDPRGAFRNAFLARTIFE